MKPGSRLYDVVIVSYNQSARLLAALESVRAVCPSARLIVVDNASMDGSVAAARTAFPSADVVALPENRGFGAAANIGVARGDAPYVLLLNNDARLRPDALLSLRRALALPGVVAAGPCIVDDRGAPELSVDRTLSPFNEARFKLIEALYRYGRGPTAGMMRRRMARSREVRSLSGACILMHREAFERVGGFDERFFLYAEDVDLCSRWRQAGDRLWYAAEAIVEHDRGASAAVAASASALHYRRSQIAYYRKHHGALASSALRAYLALRFAIRRLVGGRRQRALADRLLRLTLHESGG